jgi:hypothetical protein
VKRLSLYAALPLVLAVAGVAYAASSPSAKLAKQDRIYGGGQFGPGCFSNSAVCFPRPRNLSIDAHAEDSGVEAAGDFNYGAPGSTLEDHARVTCVRVDGNRAAVGGLITSGSNAGAAFLFYAVDRGGPASGDRDLASPEYIDLPDATTWPSGFPTTCPSPDGTPNQPAIFQEVQAGDIVVQDAPAD